MKLQGKIKKQIFLAILVSIALVLHLVEAMLPNPFPIPGAKLGLANIITLITLMLYGLKEGLIVAILRVILGSLMSGTFTGPAFLISLSAALSSTFLMSIFLKFKNVFSPISVSIIGAITHNITQLFVVALLISTFNIYLYLPFLLLVAIPVGISTGYIAGLVKSHLDKLGYK
ncbi:heptaprenyl diphosphate synthase [Desulfonispora thiosulfatigenes DSM 11270]|uniref:Heptaprenyl diphosphate synthase n=1 Tax=Desulfonispora thiosulfatigenes DSM 11270 TaxID=656914 RepID=A0A1W1UIR4_DESTI|nr:Gx transporter family protein [Desulfonispora thiosulfatigenes]SMB80967.1 heptaprenyl diphosphate synthase [Desulfonispora thiosulfatigenes DSM 11270]